MNILFALVLSGIYYVLVHFGLSAALQHGVSAIILMNLGLCIFNLFPVPLLDGGHLMFYAAEAIRGRPLPPRALEYGFRAGFALLVTLFLFASWNDIAQGAIGHWVAKLLG